MRKICYVCDRCGAEIDGDAAGIEIKQKDSRGYEDEADLIDVSALFADKKEKRAKEIQHKSWQKDFKQRKPRTWTEEDFRKAEELAAQGHSFSYIADALGVTRRSVEEHLGTENGGIPEE